MQFPEVKQAVTRIGSSEIPTDPMPMERADMLISLIPEAEWTSAKTKDELMEKMEEALSIIPGMEVEMTQLIQMRNNELITGIKQDVAIKIYGNDLDALESSAKKVASLIKNVDGVSEPFVEKVQGQPQIQVKYDRDRLAKYGISITTANRVLEAAFAGRRTGYVFEGDRPLTWWCGWTMTCATTSRHWKVSICHCPTAGRCRYDRLPKSASRMHQHKSRTKTGSGAYT